LTELDISSNAINTGLAPLAPLENLQILNLSANPGGDYSQLSALSGLTTLDLSWAAVTNLNWMASLTNLFRLTVPHNQVSDVTPLVSQGQLGMVDLSYNPIINFFVLSNLTSLGSVTVEGDHIRDIGFVASLSNLTTIDISYNLVTNIDVLLDPPGLSAVYMLRNLLDLSPGSDALSVIGALEDRGIWVSYQPQWGPPQVQIRPVWVIPANETSYLRFLANDDVTAARQLSFTATSSNPGLIPNTNISIAWWTFGLTLGVTPVSNQVGSAGITLTATDSLGLAVSTNVVVQVQSAQRLDGQAFNSSNFVWETSSTSPFYVQSNITHNGGATLKSGGAGSWLETTIQGPGTLDFWYLGVSTGWVSGEFIATCPGSALACELPLGIVPSWNEGLVSLPAGAWTLRWDTTLDDPTTVSNAFWLADVTFTPGSSGSWVSVQGRPIGGVLGLVLHDELGSTNDLEVSSDLRNWQQLSRVIFYYSTFPFTDQNAFSASRFYRLHRVSQ
jgi:hypothetical protein